MAWAVLGAGLGWGLVSVGDWAGLCGIQRYDGLGAVLHRGLGCAGLVAGVAWPVCWAGRVTSLGWFLA
jgi:hypothetical protein